MINSWLRQLFRKRSIKSAFEAEDSQLEELMAAELVATPIAAVGSLAPELITVDLQGADGGRRETHKLVDIQSVVVIAIMVLFIFLQLIGEWEDISQAIEAGDAEKVKRMLEVRPELAGKQDEFGRTPLHLAVEMGEIAVIDALLDDEVLESPADINARDRDRLSPLHLAVYQGNRDVTRFLLERGADIDVQDASKRTPLFLAVSNANVRITELLLREGADPDIRAYIPEKGTAPLHLAVEIGSLHMVRLLVEEGKKKANVEIANNLGITPSRLAFEEAKDEIAVYLRHPRSRELVEGAVRAGDACKVVELLKIRPDLLDRRMLRLILDEEIDLNARETGEGFTLLHLAVSADNPEIVRMLVNAGADPDMSDDDGQTPYELALKKERTRVADLLGIFIGDGDD